MGVNTKSFNSASDMITFSRASGAYGLTKVSYGSELVSNGTFDTDTTGSTPNTWETSSANASLIKQADGTALFTSASFAYARISNENRPVLPVGVYWVSFEISETQGSLSNVHVGIGAVGNTISGDGTYGYAYVSSSEQAYELQIRPNSGGTGSFKIDNISVKEVIYNSSAADATLQLIYHPENKPRIEYNTDGTAKGLLIEEARTNLFTNSNAIDSTLTSVQSLTVGNEEVANGVYQGTWRKFTEDTATGQHRLVGSNVVTISAGSYATISCLVKRISGTRNVELVMYSGGDSFRAGFDLDAETTTTTIGGTGVSGIATVENLGNGIYRISANGIVSTTVTNCSVIWRLTDGATSSYTGDGTSSVAATAMQIEQGAFRTSLIKTTGATATRAVDVASIGVGEFGYNQTEGTLFVDFKTPDTGGANALELGDSANGANRYLIRNGLAYYSTAGGPQVVISYTASTNNQRAGFAVQSNDAVAVVNGSTVGTDNSVTLFSNPTILGIGAYAYSLAAEKLNGHIKSIQYYPRRLTDAQLQELTT